MVKNPYKTMFKGTTNKSDNFHRPEGAGNFDNMDDYNIVKTINSKDVNIYPYTISNKITPAETNVIGFVNRVSGESANIGLGAIDGDGTDNVGIIIGGVLDFDVFDNTETMTMEWDSGESEYSIRTEATGTGIVRNLNIYTGENTGQLCLETNGDINMGVGRLTVADGLTLNGRNLFVNSDTNEAAIYFLSGGGTATTKRMEFKYVSGATDATSFFQWLTATDAGVFDTTVAQLTREGKFICKSAVIGDGTNYINISTTGDQTFVGTSGLPFAEIYVEDGSTAQSIATGTTYTKITGFATDGQENNCTSDVANDKITITKLGKYMVNCSISGSSATPNVTFKFAAFLNAVEQGQVHNHRKFAAGGDMGSASITGFIDVTSVPWDLDVRARHDNVGAVNFTPTYMNINVVQIGGT